MRASSVVSEAWRNLISGTTRAGLFALVFIAAVGALAWVDVRSVVGIVEGADQFRAEGATVQVLKSDSNIDGRRCDALSGTGALSTAGAVRQGTPIRILAMPASQITVMEVTPGLMAMLPTIAQPMQTTTDDQAGVWLSADLATVLGATPGRVVQTSVGEAMVAGVYTWPDDGRARDLGYAVIAPVPADGAFSQCWTEIWPTDPNLQGLSYVSLSSSDPGVQATLGQLNTSLGTTYDAASLLSARLTRQAPLAGIVIGVVAGYVSIRIRRLEIASNLHARLPRTDLVWQHLLEALVWVGSASIITTAGLLWAARWGNPDPSLATWFIGCRTVLAAAASALIGVLAGVMTAREKHLFRYAKER